MTGDDRRRLRPAEAPGRQGSVPEDRGWGTPTPGVGPCRHHGGCLPGVVAKNRRTMAEQEAGTYLARFEVTPLEDPVGELQKLASRGRSFMDYAESRFLESGNGEWLALHARSMGELARQLELLCKVLPVKAEVDEQKAKATLARIRTAMDVVLTDDGVALTPQQQDRLKALIGHQLGGPEPAPAPAGLRGTELALAVLDTVRRRGPNHQGWTAEERSDAEAIWRACAALTGVWGEPAEPTAEVAPAPVTRALAAVVDDAEVVEP